MITMHNLIDLTAILASFNTIAFKKLPFGERSALVTAAFGAPAACSSTSYPSGGGSCYAAWIVEREGKKMIVRLERGGYDPVTGATFSRVPEFTRPLEATEVAAGKILYAWH